MRRPSSRIAMRASWIRRMALVFVRSRPAATPWRRGRRARNCPCTAASAGQRLGDVRAAAASRASARARVLPGRRGDRRATAASGRWRPAPARAGSPSVGERISHSFGPREPNSARKSANPPRNASAAGAVERLEPVEQPSVPAVERRGQARRPGHDAAELPQRERRRRRVDVAEPGRRGRASASGLADRGADRRDDADRQRGAGTRRRCAGRTAAGSARRSSAVVRARRAPRRTASLRSGRSARRAFVARLVLEQLGQVGRLVTQIPAEGGADLLRQVGADRRRAAAVGRDARLGAEELLVHRSATTGPGPARRRAGSMEAFR